jgi:hypothetical protein
MKRTVGAALCTGILVLAAGAASAAPVKEARTKPASSAPMSLMQGPSSDAIEININTTSGDSDFGKFTIGIPNGPSLLFGHGSDPWSGFTTIRIDGTDNEHPFGTLSSGPANNGDANDTVWTIGSITVHQRLVLQADTTNNGHDRYLIQYIVHNQDAAAHDIGGRIMFDTDVNGNDGAPFNVPGIGPVVTEQDLTGTAIPTFFFVIDDLEAPQAIAQGTLFGPDVVPAPDRLVIADWGDIYDTSFDYTVTPGNSITGDSAYAVFWQPRSVAAGATVTFSTYYGLSASNIDVRPPLVTALTDPGTIYRTGTGYSPDPFAVSLLVSNTSPGVTSTVTGITATLAPGTGMAFNTGEVAAHAVPDLVPGGTYLVTWQMRISGHPAGPITYGVTVASAESGTKSLDGAIAITGSACDDQVPPSVQMLARSPARPGIRFRAMDNTGVVHEAVSIDGCPIWDGSTFGDHDGLLTDERLTLDNDTLCRAYAACSQRRWSNPVITVTATDCAGNVGRAVSRLPGRYSVNLSRCQL